MKWSNALFTIEEACICKSLLPNTTYRFRVSCINTIGVSSYSWASEEITTHPQQDTTDSSKTITIDHEQAQKLLMNQYNLEKRSQQLVLIKKLDHDLKNINYKSTFDSSTTFKIEQTDPNDLYTLEKKPIYKFARHNHNIRVFNASDKAHQTKRLIKLSTLKSTNEIKLLSELRDQDRLLQLLEGFCFQSEYAFVYAYAVPCIDFITLRHRYSEELVVRVLRQLLDACQWLHLHGFVHLNIQPMTIMNANFTQVNVKLAGLESACQLSEIGQEGAEGQMMMTMQSLEFSGKLIKCEQRSLRIPASQVLPRE